MIYIDINQSPNLIFEHNIEKKWGSVHQDLGQNERLPLPHTKGTKPAPSTVKVLVYLIQVKKKNKVVFLNILKKICTGGGARTPTLLKEMDFESTASTNSATPASLNIMLSLN